MIPKFFLNDANMMPKQVARMPKLIQKAKRYVINRWKPSCNQIKLYKAHVQ